MARLFKWFYLIAFFLATVACFSAERGSRIVGSEEARPGQFPFAVSIQITWHTESDNVTHFKTCVLDQF